MFNRSRVTTAVLWALSLVAAAQWGASAQQATGVTGSIVSGPDLGLKIDQVGADRVYGRPIIRIDGRWLEVSPSHGDAVAIPLTR